MWIMSMSTRISLRRGVTNYTTVLRCIGNVDMQAAKSKG